MYLKKRLLRWREKKNNSYSWMKHLTIIIIWSCWHFSLDTHNPLLEFGQAILVDSQETKLPGHWNTTFSKVCLGKKIVQQIKLTVNNVHANSLYSVIADGKYRATSLGRNAWKTPISSQASMLFAALSLTEQELVPLRTTKMLAAAVTPELSFVQLDMLMILTRVRK